MAEINKTVKKNVKEDFEEPGLFHSIFNMLGPKEPDMSEDEKRQAEYDKIRKQNGQNFGR